LSFCCNVRWFQCFTFGAIERIKKYLIVIFQELEGVRVRIIVFKSTFNNISVISWQSVLLVEKTGVHRENHRPATSLWQTLSHNVVSSTLRKWTWFELTTLVVIGTDYTGGCKSNYHAITTMTDPCHFVEISSVLQCFTFGTIERIKKRTSFVFFRN
jgi:hypothetical protein